MSGKADAIKVGLDAIVQAQKDQTAAIAALQAQVASGTGVSQADIDNVHAQAVAISAKLDAIQAEESPAPVAASVDAPVTPDAPASS